MPLVLYQIHLLSFWVSHSDTVQHNVIVVFYHSTTGLWQLVVRQRLYTCLAWCYGHCHLQIRVVHFVWTNNSARDCPKEGYHRSSY